MVTAKYEFFTDVTGKLQFCLKAANGKILAGSEGLGSTAAAETDVKSGMNETPDVAAIHESVQPKETPHDIAMRKQRKLNELARQRRLKRYNKDGSPS